MKWVNGVWQATKEELLSLLFPLVVEAEKEAGGGKVTDALNELNELILKMGAENERQGKETRETCCDV